MANRCPGCGGTLRFDIQKQKLVCDYCKSEFDADSMEDVKSAEERPAFNGESMDAKIFTCPNCGAEVFATDLDAVEYCSYCGTFVTLQSRLARIQKPSYIVPFNITKEKCIELYKHLTFESKEYILSKQMVRSGTSIGANIKEAVRGQSNADFISKMSISLKEASII